MFDNDIGTYDGGAFGRPFRFDGLFAEMDKISRKMREAFDAAADGGAMSGRFSETVIEDGRTVSKRTASYDSRKNPKVIEVTEDDGGGALKHRQVAIANADPFRQMEEMFRQGPAPRPRALPAGRNARRKPRDGDFDL